MNVAGATAGGAQYPALVRRALPSIVFALLAAGPTVLAFFSGGYFDAPRAAAAAVAWALVLALALAGPAPAAREHSRPGGGSGARRPRRLDGDLARLGSARASR